MEAGPAEASAGRFVKPWSGVIAGSRKYEVGGDQVIVPGGVLVSLMAAPGYDGETYVGWNGDGDDPRIQVFVQGDDGRFREAEAGSDQSAVRRRFVAYIAS